ncbi:MAG: PD40 domain-containing protein [Candidatus Kapabacteria bacterium]|nr:PD40 domain-containing protein [Ignavibacteriota bacterium]MCW5883824.1 PD40 domain-containing protein [Candidatus Kapabacteria bacterium]
MVKSTRISMYLLILGLSISLISCIYPGVKLKVPDCPQPSQNCYPQKWSGKPEYDTVKNNTRSTGYYFQIDKIKGINTPDDEWQIAFVNANEALITFSESNFNKVMTARKIAVNEFAIEKGIRGLEDGHTGIFSINKNKAAYTVSPNKNPNFVKKHYYDELATTESITGRSKIYISNFSGSRLSESYEFDDPDLKELDWNGHPALSPDGKVFFFASDKDGGEGGTDIWLAISDKKGVFYRSFNIGKVINSKCDEVSPFVASNGKRLYFSSAGHNTVGGYDIFYSEIYPSFWLEIDKIDEKTEFSKYFSVPVNLGTPVNTPYDELFPSSPGDCSELLYYSSNQAQSASGIIESAGGFDIYVIHKLPFTTDKKPETKPIDIAKTNLEETKKPLAEPETISKSEITVKGSVYDKNTNHPIDSALVSVRKEQSDQVEMDIHTNRFGKFEFPIETNVQYEITAQKNEYFFDSKRVLLPSDFSQDTADLNFYLPEIGEIRINFPTDEYNNPYKYTLDTNGIETGRYWLDELKLVAGNIMLSVDRIDKIILVGHTDDVGTDDYNMGLGQRRVNFVIDELVKIGVPREILFARSAGEREPLTRNLQEDIVTFRKRLRRVTMEKFFK